jgi:hypothetical protein
MMESYRHAKRQLVDRPVLVHLLIVHVCGASQAEAHQSPVGEKYSRSLRHC